MKNIKHISMTSVFQNEPRMTFYLTLVNWQWLWLFTLELYYGMPLHFKIDKEK